MFKILVVNLTGKPDIQGKCNCSRPCKEKCEAYERCGGCKHPIICPHGGECGSPEFPLLDVYKFSKLKIKGAT